MTAGVGDTERFVDDDKRINGRINLVGLKRFQVPTAVQINIQKWKFVSACLANMCSSLSQLLISAS